MFEGKTEQQAKEQILDLVKEYCETYHNVKKPFEAGQRIPYASHVYDIQVSAQGFREDDEIAVAHLVHISMDE